MPSSSGSVRFGRAATKAATAEASASNAPRAVAVPTATTVRPRKSTVRRGVHCRVGMIPQPDQPAYWYTRPSCSGIIPTLQWTPRRTVLFLGHTVVAVGTATALGALLALASAVAAFVAARPNLTLPLDDGIDTLATVAFVFAAGTTAFAAGLGFVLRNTADGLVAVFLLILLLPLILPQFGYDWLTNVADLLPRVARGVPPERRTDRSRVHRRVLGDRHASSGHRHSPPRLAAAAASRARTGE